VSDGSAGKGAKGPGQFAEYAEHYDLLYKDKDYAKEAQYISGLIHDHATKNKRDVRILDLACGTGRHARELVTLGYTVDGSDISAEMIAIASSRNREQGFTIEYFNESFQTCSKINKKYDVVLALFAAINYLTTYEDLSLALANIASLMDEKSLFIFDFWNGNAVLSDYSPVRIKRMSSEDKKVIRISETSLDRISQVASVEFQFMFLENDVVKKEYSEKHLVRYFFIQEITDLLKANNFHVVTMCPFMEPERVVAASDWNITFVVKKLPERHPVV